MTYDEAITRVSKDCNLPKHFIDKVYRAYWKAVKEHIAALPLKEDLTDEEFLKLQPNINIPSLGKLYVTLDRYKRMKKMQEIKNNIKENNDVTCN